MKDKPIKSCKHATCPPEGCRRKPAQGIKRTPLKRKSPPEVKELKAKEVKKVSTPSIKLLDGKLWKVFSEFIRLRDSDGNGNVKCFTCSNIRHWTRVDCGHGVGRQHKATKYDEKNNHGQCKHCNGFEGGKREVYKVEMDKRYGEGTWDLMELKAKQRSKWTAFEFEALINHYREKVKELKTQKGII